MVPNLARASKVKAMSRSKTRLIRLYGPTYFLSFGTQQALFEIYLFSAPLPLIFFIDKMPSGSTLPKRVGRKTRWRFSSSPTMRPALFLATRLRCFYDLRHTAAADYTTSTGVICYFMM